VVGSIIQQILLTIRQKLEGCSIASKVIEASLQPSRLSLAGLLICTVASNCCKDWQNKQLVQFGSK
jgi:hypothetical protein